MENLKALSNKDYQLKVWAAVNNTSGDVSLFEEDVYLTFDDSGLGDYLNTDDAADAVVFGIDKDQFEAFSKAID